MLPPAACFLNKTPHLPYLPTPPKKKKKNAFFLLCGSLSHYLMHHAFLPPTIPPPPLITHTPPHHTPPPLHTHLAYSQHTCPAPPTHAAHTFTRTYLHWEVTPHKQVWFISTSYLLKHCIPLMTWCCLLATSHHVGIHCTRLLLRAPAFCCLYYHPRYTTHYTAHTRRAPPRRRGRATFYHKTVVNMAKGTVASCRYARRRARRNSRQAWTRWFRATPWRRQAARA